MKFASVHSLNAVSAKAAEAAKIERRASFGFASSWRKSETSLIQALLFVVLAVLPAMDLSAQSVEALSPKPSIPSRIEQERLIHGYLERALAADPDSVDGSAFANAGAQSRTVVPYPHYPQQGFYTQAGTSSQIEDNLDANLDVILEDLTATDGLLSKFYTGKTGKSLEEGKNQVIDKVTPVSSTELDVLTIPEKYALAMERLAMAEKLFTTENVQHYALVSDVQNVSASTIEDAVDLAISQARAQFYSYLGSPPSHAKYAYLTWYSGQFHSESNSPYNSRAIVSMAFSNFSPGGAALGLNGNPRLYAKADFHTGDGSSPITANGRYQSATGLLETRFGGIQGAASGQAELFLFELDGFNIDPGLEPDEEDCPEICEGEKCAEGSGGAELGSAHYQFSLGQSRFGKTSGSIKLSHEEPDPEWYTPRGLEVEGGYGFRAIQKSSTYDLLQAVGPGVLVDVEVISPTSYELRYYHWDGSGTPASDGTYTLPAGSPHTVFLVDNPDETGETHHELRITRTAGTDVDVWTFSYDSGTEAWTLTSDNGNTIESIREYGDTDPTLRLEERVVKDGDDVVLSKVVRTYKTFEWGEELISVVSDPDGAALTKTWSFYDDEVADGQNYRKMHSRTDEYGHWEVYTYDGYGRLLKVKKQHGGTSFDSAESSNHVTEYVYPSAAGPGIDYYTTIEKLLGTEIGRQYRRVKIDGYDEITCTVPGAGIEAATNLVREVRLHLGNEYAGMVRSERHHDRTLTLYEYTALDGLGNPDIDNGEMLTTVVEKGEPNGAGTDIIDGIRTTTVVDRRGNEIARTIVDIASGLTIEQRLATEQDGFGRATELTHLDGRTETFDYDCCGLASQTDVLGITTSYDEVDGIEESETRLGVTVTTRREGRSTVVERSDGTTTISLGGEARDIAGRTVATVGRGGRTTTISRAINGSGNRVVTYTLPNNATRIEEILPDGRLLRVTGTGVNGQAFEYGIETGQYFVKTTELDAAGDPTSEWTKNFYDGAGRLWKVVRANGATWLTEFDAEGQVSRTVDPDGIASLYDYDGQGRLETVAVDLDDSGTIGFAGIDRITRVSKSVVSGPGAFPVVRTTSEIWRSNGSATPSEILRVDAEVTGKNAWMSTPAGTSHRKLVFGDPGSWTITNDLADGSRSVESYSGGRLTRRVISNGANVVLAGSDFDYDDHGRLETATDFRNGATTYTYHSTDEVASVTTPAPGDGRPAQTTSYTYTSLGLVDTVTMPDAGVVDYNYNPKGLLETVTGARVYEQSYTYTDQGRRATMVTNPGTAFAQTTSWFYHPLSGLLSSQSFPGGNSVSFTYTDAGRLLTKTNGRSTVATYAYDGAGENSGVNYSDTTIDLSYTFHRDGSLETVTHGAETRTFGYGSPGVMTSETVSGGILDGLALTTGRDALNRRTSLTVAYAGESFSQTRGYQPNTSRLDFVAEGVRSATYQYHPDSSLLKSTVHRSDGTIRLLEERSYDNLGMLSKIASMGTGATTPVRRSYGYTHDGINQVVGVTREDDFDWTYGYDADGHLETASRKLPNGTALAGEQFGYDYDPLGNRTEATFGGGSGGTHTVGYIPATGDISQIDEIENPGVALITGQAKATATVLVDSAAPADRQGERFADAVTVDNSSGAVLAEVPVSAEEGANLDSTTVKKLVPEANIFYTYDGDGNVTSDGFFGYVWDAENRLLSAETLSGAAPAGVAEIKVEYRYDYLGRRNVREAYRKVSGSWALDEEQVFVHDGTNIVGEWNGAGDLVRSILWGADISGSAGGAGGAGGLVSITEYGGTSPLSHFASFDGGGNLIGLTDSATGEAAALYDYDPYGRLIASSGPMAETNPLRFGTQWRDPATGLDLYHYRVYDPEQGRWLSRDPLGEAGGMNLYGFLGNSPVGGADLLGLVDYRDPMVYAGDPVAEAIFVQTAAMEAFVDGTKRGFELWARDLVTPLIETGVFLGNEVAMILHNPEEYAAVWGARRQMMAELAELVGRFWTDKCFQKRAIEMFGEDIERMLSTPEGIAELLRNLSVAGIYGAAGGAAGKGTLGNLKKLADMLRRGSAVDGPGGKPSAPRPPVRTPDLGDESVTDAPRTPLTGPLRGPCFAAGTLVSTSEGEKPIEEVKAGDTVFAYDFASAQVVEKTVTQLNWGETRCWIHVGVDTGDEIKATRFHPFWVENRNAWVDALDLEPGMVLRLKSGALARVTWVRAEILDNPEATFNFEVADVHNYFVASGVLVHNGGPPSPEQLLGLEFANKSAFESAQTFQLEGAKAGRAALQSEGLWGRGFRLDIPTQMQDLTLPGNQPHIHGFDAKGKPWSLNINGTVHDAKASTGVISNDVKAALRGAGWGC